MELEVECKERKETRAVSALAAINVKNKLSLELTFLLFLMPYLIPESSILLPPSDPRSLPLTGRTRI
jgi:hypothetical protein